MNGNEDLAHLMSGNSLNENEREYRTRIWEKLQTAGSLQSHLVLEAMGRGVAETELPAFLADAMKAGAVPAVVPEAATTRSSPIRPVFLGGEIPAEALSVTVAPANESTDDKPRVYVTSAGFDDESLFSKTVYEVAAKSGGAFTVVGENQLEEQFGVQEGREVLLAQLDATLAPFEQPEPVEL